MQTITSSETVSASHLSLPSAAQLHTSQLEDYELMLSAMRQTGLSTTDPLQELIAIRFLSPLYQASEDGFIALWQLQRDNDYQTLCKELQTRLGYLIVTLKDGNYVYETSDRARKKVTLALTGNAKWQALKTRIEHAATLLGGQIRSDRHVNLARMCGFYGIAPWNPQSAQENKATVNVLQEKIASHHLRLEDDFDILDLRREPTEADRAAFQAARQLSPNPAQLNTQELHANIIRAEIIEAVKRFLPEENTSPLTHLAQEILSAATTEQIRATPTVYLQKILQSTEAEKLGRVLLSAMDWYGKETAEESSPSLRIKLIAYALQLWLASQTSENPDGIAGYAWQDRSNWGKSYAAIQTKFEAHLLTSKCVSSEKEAIVSARLFLSRFPAEFRVRDIPLDLGYRSSIVWVNFVNGVNFVKAANPGLLDRLPFQQLVNLPMQQAEGATTEELGAISLTRLLATIEWAQTQGLIGPKRLEDYANSEIDLALSELDKHTNDLNEAVSRINEEPPKRLSMAESKIQALFGAGAFISDGRKLARKDVTGPTSFRDPPPLKGKEFDYYSFTDVLASGKFDDQKIWLVTETDGSTISEQWIRINEVRRIKTAKAWTLRQLSEGKQIVMSPHSQLPDIKELFDDAFKHHLERITSAYETLIRSLLASLPLADRQALEFGEVRVYSLRKKAPYTLAQEETPKSILALRARNGLILQTTHDANTFFHELLPKSGVIRRLDSFDPELIGGRFIPRGQLLDGTDVHMWGEKSLPFDWEAHSNGNVPKNNAHCSAIIEALGSPFAAAQNTLQSAQSIPLTLSSSRSVEISHHIATELLFVDPKALRSYAFGQTQFDRDAAKNEKALAILKGFVPFWGSIEDLMTADRNKRRWGAIGLFFDVLSFALPVGKFALGSVKVVRTAGQLGMRAALPSFKSLTKNLLISSFRGLNPLDALPALLRGLGNAVRGIGNFAIYTARLAGKGQPYKYVRSLPQLGDAGAWKPLAVGDQLAIVKGIDDVPVRNVASIGKPDYRLIDPLSSKPYGPSLSTQPGELSLGRSRYSPLEKTNNHVIVELPENTRVREVLEVDGRSTFFLDDVPYRLDDDSLRRVSSLDASETLKQVPCRVRRAPGDICKTRYVKADDPADTPAPGSFTEDKGWAPWFGDSAVYPSKPKQGQPYELLAYEGKVYEHTKAALIPYTGMPKWRGLAQKKPVIKASIPARMQFQRGIYGRLQFTGTAENIDDIHDVGAIIVHSKDKTKKYVFSRINTDDYYMAELSATDNIQSALTMKLLTDKPPLKDTLHEELLRVYNGSLNANNTARIHGVDKLERALKKMEEIAIPIGTPKNPSDQMAWLSVDTVSSEALMFDHQTRMIVSELPDGAALWKPHTGAPAEIQKSTADIFERLFTGGTTPITTTSKPTADAVKINQAMERLQGLLPKNRYAQKTRNIAFAEVHTTTGRREVYVSVSGAGDNTQHLPLFKSKSGHAQVELDSTTYFNIDKAKAFIEPSSLHMSSDSKLLAIPHITNDANRTDVLTRPTSVDSESKLIGYISEKYPDSKDLRSITVTTTLPPCDSCSIVMKEFGHERGASALNVTWGNRPNPLKRKADDTPDNSGSSSSSTTGNSSSD